MSIEDQDNNKDKDHNQDMKHDEGQQRETTDEDLFSEEDEGFFEAFGEKDEDEELKPNPLRKWIIRIVAFTLILALAANVLVMWPSVYNMPAIQFLKKSKELSEMDHIQEYKQAVVVIEADNRRGTGFNITPEGMIVTNDHVVENANSIIVRFPGGEAFRGEIIISQADQDLAILALHTEVDNAEPLPTLKLASNVIWEEREQVYFIGNPLSFSLIANEGRVINQVQFKGEDIETLVLDAPVYRGNSGSPVINNEGVVIGVIYATREYTEEEKERKVGLAIPIVYVHELLSQIVN